MPLTAKVTQMPGYGRLLGETTSTVETLEPFTFVRMISIPVREAFHVRRIVKKVQVVPLAWVSLVVI